MKPRKKTYSWKGPVRSSAKDHTPEVGKWRIFVNIGEGPFRQIGFDGLMPSGRRELALLSRILKRFKEEFSEPDINTHIKPMTDIVRYCPITMTDKHALSVLARLQRLIGTIKDIKLTLESIYLYDTNSEETQLLLSNLDALGVNKIMVKGYRTSNLYPLMDAVIEEVVDKQKPIYIHYNFNTSYNYKTVFNEHNAGLSHAPSPVSSSSSSPSTSPDTAIQSANRVRGNQLAASLFAESPNIWNTPVDSDKSWEDAKANNYHKAVGSSK